MPTIQQYDRQIATDQAAADALLAKAERAREAGNAKAEALYRHSADSRQRSVERHARIRDALLLRQGGVYDESGSVTGQAVKR